MRLSCRPNSFAINIVSVWLFRVWVARKLASRLCLEPSIHPRYSPGRNALPFLSQVISSIVGSLPVHWPDYEENPWPPSTSGSAHQFHPGDLVWMKRISAWTLEPTWKGPYPVILTTPAAVKTCVIPWEKGWGWWQMGHHLDLGPLKDKTDQSLLICSTCSPQSQT